MKMGTHQRYVCELGVFLGGIWILLYWSLSVHWSATEQYRYGWMVPVLTAYVAMVRWKTRPVPSVGLRAGYWVAGGAALLFLPTWLLFQPNPDWRLLGWILTSEIVGITLGLVALIGGAAWVKHFVFPCLFIFTAVPLPRPWEIPVVTTLTGAMTQFSVEALNLAGRSAVAHGNIIEVRTGFLGVEEACSGIRSLQAAIMVSLFCGEFFPLATGRRVLLLAFGILAAVATNVARTFFLAWHAANDGIVAVEKWHDTAAHLALSVCFLLVFAAGWAARRRPISDQAKDNPVIGPALLPHRFLRILAIWVSLAISMVELWFYEGKEAKEEDWSLRAPTNARPITISKWVAEELRADEQQASEWKDEEGKRWQLFFFRWKAGPARSRLLARLHRPEHCLPAAGLTLIADRKGVIVPMGEMRLGFHAYTFEQDGALLFVYWGAWEEQSSHAPENEALSESLTVAAFQSVKWRERNLGQRVAELAVSGCANVSEADAALQRMLPTLLVRKGH